MFLDYVKVTTAMQMRSVKYLAQVELRYLKGKKWKYDLYYAYIRNYLPKSVSLFLQNIINVMLLLPLYLKQAQKNR
jgi:hypothetical protein